MRRLRLLFLVAGAAAVLGVASTAHAGSPFRLAEAGDRPNAVVGPSGTAHVVWNARAGDGDLVTHYCRLPRGATACDAEVVLPIPRRSGTTFSSLDGPYVFTSGAGRVVVATYRNGSFDRPDGIGDRGLFVFVSDDDGRTFGAATIVGTQSPSGDAILGPGDAIMAISDAETGGTFFQSAPLAGFTSTIANLGAGPSQWFNGSAAADGDGTTLAAFDDLSTVFFRTYSGAADINDPASWSATAVAGPGTDTRLAGGPRGIYLMAKTGSSKKRYVIRRFGAGAFGRPRALSTRGDPIFNDLTQDGGGRLHAVWLNGARALVGRASDGTSFWGPARELVPSSVSMFDIELAAGADGRGIVVWRGGGIHAARLNPACANRIVGTRRADTLGGTTRGDHVLGLRGGDTLRGRAGDDCVEGGSGADRLFGQAGDDELGGGPGRDRVDGGAGDDTIDGGAGFRHVDRAGGCRRVAWRRRKRPAHRRPWSRHPQLRARERRGPRRSRRPDARLRDRDPLVGFSRCASRRC